MALGGARHLEAKVAVAVVPVIDDGRVEGLCNKATPNITTTHACRTLVPREHQAAKTHISVSLNNIPRVPADHWRVQPVLRVQVVEQVGHHGWGEGEREHMRIAREKVQTRN